MQLPILRRMSHKAKRKAAPKPLAKPVPYSTLDPETKSLLQGAVTMYRQKHGIAADHEVMVILPDPFPPGNVLVFDPAEMVVAKDDMLDLGVERD